MSISLTLLEARDINDLMKFYHNTEGSILYEEADEFGSTSKRLSSAVKTAKEGETINLTRNDAMICFSTMQAASQRKTSIGIQAYKIIYTNWELLGNKIKEFDDSTKIEEIGEVEEETKN
jgi:hypothetical protein